MLVTGHLKDGTMDLDWHGLVRPRQTLVIYMGLMGLEALCRQLIAHGLAAETPAAVVQQATLPEQRVVAATLETLAAEAQRAQLRPPTLVIVGEVVRLRDKLDWYSVCAAAPAGADLNFDAASAGSAARSR
jgi:uroporphyrin-III C-methyltransferase/precorrin-2 dehydrogenase/sirohydrochlorin ferrochelatase